MKSKVKIGIIGSGGIAGAHVRAYKQMPDVEIVGVADVIPGKAEEFVHRQELANAQAFESHLELLEMDIDGVSICTPNIAHHQTSVDALQAGKHVLVEKPLAITLEQGIEMVQAGKKAEKILTVGFQPRYDPNMQAVKKIVQSELGNVYYIQTGGGRRRGMPGGTFISKSLAGAGAMADIGCYSLDLALNALDYPKPLSVSAFTSNHFGTDPLYHPEAERFEVEDFGVALVRLEGGKVLNFKVSWAMHADSLGPTLFLGTDAGLKLTPAGSGPWSGVWDGGIGSITMFHDVQGHHTESIIPVQQHHYDIFFEKVRDFVVAIKEDKPAPIPGEEILINQAIIDGILRSSELGKEVEIDIPEL
ncbi:Gfo/Idh/MocA family protein [Lederbergia galactosidilytica]|uniref:Oxidoreductase n=1 Tax=Lederbergia galactosidilytica TaxID=217031 RepID=A0A177ZMS3_9BACI|nr:Gfo/Idh/MocA family oxidoreductase [Lederbergia galactosidilytica]KRG14558.1 oxidoreductase [Virgibacillus soli]MBP1915359.1 putative dehydrogenase [Lederbergia galactosidilytica]OAK68178.1 oxidoreductase [Lederbergia galactosidilytica]